MSTFGWVLIVLAAIVAVADWLAVARGNRSAERLLKPVVPLILVAVALGAQPQHPTVRTWLVLALLLSAVGDLALSLEPARVLAGAGAESGQAGSARPAMPAEPVMPTEPAVVAEPAKTEPAFGVGLGAFFLGHLCYLAAMLSYGSDGLSIGFGLLLVLLVVLAFGHRILAGAQATGGTALTCAVSLYVAALGSVVVLGVGTTSLWIAAGVVLFAASDLTLASDRFVRPRPWAPLAVITSYHVAQLLLLIGLTR